MNNKLWYTSPAETFDKALPIGNGSFGAMVYGNFPREKISLNLDTFWSGHKRKAEREIPESILSEVRQKIERKEYKDAQEQVERQLLGTYNESYMPFGMFWYEVKGIKDIKNYRRSLDLEKALVAVEYESNAGLMNSKIFASNPDSCIAGKIENTEGSKFSLHAGFESKIKSYMMKSGAGSNELQLVLEAPSHVEPNYVKIDEPILYDKDNPGMTGVCTVRFRIIGTDANIKIEETKIVFENVSEVEYYLAASDGYKGYDQEINNNLNELIAENQICLDKIEKFSFEQLLQRHIADYGSLFKTVDVSLSQCSEDDELPTNQRLELFRKGKDDKGLITLCFQYNRYLMIASSRSGSQPANLQGIWSESRRPVWSSNWTININTEMNYWMVAPCNLLECYMPLVDMVQELSQEGKKTAEKQYQCKGWVANHNVDLWRQTAPVAGEAKYAYWPMGGVWLSNQIMDYYRYTQDKTILIEKILPIIEGAAEFCVDWLFLGVDGKYHTAPSVSPENSFVDEYGNVVSVSKSCTMDISLIKELFHNLLAIYEIEGISNTLSNRVNVYLKDLPDYRVGKHGELLEWAEEFEEEDAGHRHFSHLVGFHPGRTINKISNPELVSACEKSIERRLGNGGGHIGWSCSWLINFYARLGNGEKALDYYKQLLMNSSYDNLFDLHPPLGENDGEREVFQIDGNFGSAAGFASMFMQSYLGIIELLPALPRAWPEGYINGLLAEGGFEISISWKNNKLIKTKILSLNGNKATVQYQKHLKLVDKNNNVLKESGLAGNLEFSTEAGQQYVIYCD